MSFFIFDFPGKKKIEFTNSINYSTEAGLYKARAPRAYLSSISSGSMDKKSQKSIENRSNFLKQIAQSNKKHIFVNQVHSQNFVVVDLEDNNSDLSFFYNTDADALLSSNDNVFLSVTVADCMPIWIWNRKSSLISIIHSGWRGTGIFEKVLSYLTDRCQAEPEDISCILGPCIGSCCYKVDASRLDIFKKNFGPNSVLEDAGALDLRKANMSIASKFKINSILSIEVCTCCDLRLGSYRRQGLAKDQFCTMIAGVSSAR